MKKSVTFMLLLAIAGSANAGIVLQSEKRIYVCPKELTTSGKSIVYTHGDGEVTVYTPDFLVDKTFKVPVQEYQTGSFEEEATVKLTHLNAVPTESWGETNYDMYDRFPASSQEEMISELQSEYGGHYTAFTDPMGNPACYNQYTSYDFKYQSIFGEQYPTEWYALIDGIVYRIYTYSDFYTPGYDEASAVWTRTSEDISTYEDTDLERFIIKWEGRTREFDDIYISQTLFNNDDKWEYVKYDYSEVETEYYSPDVKGINEDGTVTLERRGRIYTSGKYFVYNEDGERLGEMEIGMESEMGMSVINGKPYMHSYNILYSILSDGGDIDLVETVRGKDNRSLGARRGIVTVDINEEQAGGEVVVSTPDGKVMASKKVGKGQTQVNDRPLPAGIYVVSLLKDGKVMESEKYLVQ